jgi:beta-lactamase class A
MQEVERHLGENINGKLAVVRWNRRYGLIYDRPMERQRSLRVAKEHSALLSDAGLDAVIVVGEEAYPHLYNVIYGIGPNVKQLLDRYAIIYRHLGKDVGKSLVLERTRTGRYALVYKRRGDLPSTWKIARKHHRLLHQKHLQASIIKERNNALLYGEASYLNDKAQKGSSVTRARLERPRGRIKRKDSSLEDAIDAFVKSLRKRGVIDEDETTAWSVFDFSNEEKLVSINEDVSHQCASMMKPFLALGFFRMVVEQKTIYGPKSRARMRAMIQKSSNPAANWIMRQIGGPRGLHVVLKSRYPGIFKQTQILEYIPRNGKTYRNRASAHDYSRFLYALWHGSLPHAQELKRLMALPGQDRIYSGAQRVPFGTRVLNKTGSTARLCGDMGIIEARGTNGRRYAYTLIGIIERKTRARRYGAWGT